ncbi:serine protease gd-like, partial [Ctenocephalides felis]|uniref:serine protease gd-like n=1 Tax=Ctenocephalides felis TaxID=7515 RepID=UPI000E6E537D
MTRAPFSNQKPVIKRTTSIPITSTTTGKPPEDSSPKGAELPHILNEMNSMCGQTAVRPLNLVVGGEATARGDWPWLVALYVVSDNGPTFKCGSTLISRKLVVTDALQTGAEKAIPHPDFKPKSDRTDADIGLVILAQTVEFTSFIKPICLWRGNADLQNIMQKNGTVVGWGRDETGRKTTPEPRMASVPVVSRDDCMDSKEEFRHILTSKRMFCAGARGLGPCNGDSGGVLMFPLQN